VARYYFDVQNGKPLVRDDEGAEFDSLEAAVHATARSAAEIGPAGSREAIQALLSSRCGTRRTSRFARYRIDTDRATRPIPSGVAFLECVSPSNDSLESGDRVRVR
jgi:hypothetical protein